MLAFINHHLIVFSLYLSAEYETAFLQTRQSRNHVTTSNKLCTIIAFNYMTIFYSVKQPLNVNPLLHWRYGDSRTQCIC